MKCLYDILEVEVTADDATIRSAYRRLALRYHPGEENLAQHAKHLVFICILGSKRQFITMLSCIQIKTRRIQCWQRRNSRKYKMLTKF